MGSKNNIKIMMCLIRLFIASPPSKTFFFSVYKGASCRSLFINRKKIGFFSPGFSFPSGAGEGV